MDFLSALNQQQREAVTETDGPLLILAGAGSGKTRVITYRIAYLIAERNVAPHNILAVTFTNKAAEEMRERVRRLLADSPLASAPLISTFHSLCVRILRQHIEALNAGYTRSFTIYDQDDSVRLVKACIKDLGYDDKQLAPRATQGAISGAKNRHGDDAESYTARVEYNDEKRTAIARVFKLYEERLVNNNALDFDDLLIKTVQLLRRVPEVRDYYNNRFRYILVDEYQDTNMLQFALIRFLTEKHQNICVVGDEDQCVIEGTPISTKAGILNAENIRPGDMVLSAKGDSRTQYSAVTDVFCRQVTDQPVVTIRTKSGREVTTTPEHVHFARYMLGGEDLFFTYLMFKRGMGYRIGTTRRYRFEGPDKPSLGFIQRTNQERADAIWLLEACRTDEEARGWEQYYAAKFGLPTCVFVSVPGAKLSQSTINHLFSRLDTESAAKKLLTSKNMFIEQPHHVPKCITTKRRRNFGVTLCKDGRHNTLHYCEVLGTDNSDAESLRLAGLHPTASKRTGWRIRATSQDFGQIMRLHDKVSAALGDVNLILKAGFASGLSLYFTPASHVLPGMKVYIQTDAGIDLDEVEAVERWTYTGNVYDFNVERTHNFVAGGIFTHNSVYKWRGADITNILNFEQHYPDAKVIRLEQNYRSTQTILDVAGAVVKHNTERKGKTLWTANPSGERIRYYQAFDSDAEARFVAAKIEEHRRVDPDIRAAVLYRTNAQSRVFEEALRRAGIAYNIVGGFSFYERMEVRDIISYLKLALNPHDSIALMRVINSPARGLGKQTLDEIERRAKDYGVSHWETISIVTEQEGQGLSPRAKVALKNFKEIITNLVTAAGNAASSESPVSDVVKAAILDTGYANALKAENSDEAEARLENLQELVNAAVDYDKQEGEGLRDFIDHAALVSDTDQYKRDAPVTLMTMHAAKGLEFPLVFIVGLEDGLFPHSRSATDPAELEEERRLCYVAITRAERFLYVTHAMKRRVYGEEMASEPSQFLNEMPLDLMEDLSRGNSWLSFARSSSTLENKHAAEALRGDTRERTKYTGKTYDSADSIAEFFRKRGQQLGGSTPRTQPEPTIKRRAASASASNSSTSSSGGDFAPGSHVRHPKYGRGLVLRREGTGDSAKLTVSFPGFGQKKLIEKYAGLEKA
ncbi:MAG TPA: UvrD-helicase domain-containing protein [Pyrinomonadaceae bacterium]|nr:UvrD-helicase domain-containing protein [Pyrinomonadaceae bacterium]